MAIQIQNSWICFETYAGSRMYGTSTPESDTDIRGVCIRPYGEILDPFRNFEQQEYPGQDKVIYDLRKFFDLASKGNPNIVELLFSPEESTIHASPAWEMIRENAALFLNQRVRYTFSGYAHQQLERIRRHRKWILNPPTKEPIRSDYGLPEMPKAIGDKLIALLQTPIEMIIPEEREYAIQEGIYHADRKHWKEYLQWKKTRNPARYALEEKFGYDTKHAAHLYRLYSEGAEILRDNRITLPRPDREFLLEIRRGILTYEELLEMGDNFKQQIDSIPSNLPKRPDCDKLKELYIRCLEMANKGYENGLSTFTKP